MSLDLADRRIQAAGPALLGFLLAATQASANLPPPKDADGSASAAAAGACVTETAGGAARGLEAARAMLRAGRYACAERVAQRAAAETPSDPEIYEFVAWAQLKLGRWGPAMQNANTAVDLDRSSAKAYLVLAFAYELSSFNPTRVASSLETAAKLDHRYKPLLGKLKAGERLFQPAAGGAGSDAGDGFVLPAAGPGGRGTNDTLFLDGVVPSGEAPSIGDMLPWLALVGLLGLLAGLAARRSWSAQRTGARGAGPARARPPDLWDSVLGRLGAGFARLEERVTGKAPRAGVTGPVARVPQRPLTGPPAAAQRAGGTPFRSKTSPHTPKTRPAGSTPPPPVPGSLWPAGDARTKYEQVRMLGRNEDGVLWEGFDRTLQRAIALEEVTLVAGDPRRAAALARMKELAMLRHPAILDLYDFADLGDRLWLIFELVEGRTLKDRVLEAGRLPYEEARDILSPVCEALEFAHGHGLLHRHLKPSRVILADAGYVKLSGFEVIRGAERGRRYLAPEAERGSPRPESDVYSLGVCLYEMLSGRTPFTDEDSERKLRLDISALSPQTLDAPPSVDTLVARALSPALESRLCTPRQFLEALHGAELEPAPPQPLQPPSQRPSAGKPDWWRKLRKADRKRP